jgi:hypothetical protein
MIMIKKGIENPEIPGLKPGAMGDGLANMLWTSPCMNCFFFDCPGL